MDATSTLTVFGTILGIVVAIGAILDFILNRQAETPQQRRNLRFSVFITLIALFVILIGQYLVSPGTSLATLIPGVPFPGSTLKNCQVSVADLPGTGLTPEAAPTYTGTEKPLSVGGSSALYDVFTAMGNRYDKQHLGTTHTQVDKLDSGQGLRNLANKNTQIGLADFYVQEDPDPNAATFPLMLDYQVAVAPFTLIVSANLKDAVQNLTTQQIDAIFGGTITNWRSVGGPDESITVINRKLGSGTRVNFEKYVLGTSLPKDDFRASTTTALVDLLASTNGAIGYVATSAIIGNKYPGKVFPVCINGYGATMSNINSGNYTFWSYEHAYITANSGDTAKDFLNFVCDNLFQPGQEADTLHAGYLNPNVVAKHSAALVTHGGDYPNPQKCGQ